MAICNVHYRKLSWFERHAAAVLTAIAFAGVVVLAAVLRFWQLGIRTFSDDESVYSLLARKLASGGGFAHVPELHGPIHIAVTAGIFKVFGAGDMTARIAPAACGVLLAVLPFAFTRFIGRSGAIAAALLLAVSPSLVYYSRFAGPDMYLAFFTLASAMVLWRYLAAPSRGWLYLLAVTLAGMIVSTEMALLIAPIFAVYLHYRVAGEFVGQSEQPRVDPNARRTHYDLLGITPNANVREVRSAYKTQIDRAGSYGERETLASAYHVLTNDNRRAAYDRKLAKIAADAEAAALEDTPGIGTRIALGLSATVIAATWPFAGFAKRRLNLKSLPASADALIVMLLLMLPFYGPLVEKLPFIGDQGFDGQRQIVVLGGTNVNPGGELPVMFTTLAILFGVTMVLGLAWKWHAFVICWAAFYGIALTLFTGFFSDRGGVWTGVWGTLDYTWRPESRHADGPAFYYGMMAGVYEFLPLAACGLGLLALIVLGGMRNRVVVASAAIAIAGLAAMPDLAIVGEYRLLAATAVAGGAALALRVPSLTKFLGFWTVAAFCAFSIVGRKDPWLTVHVALPAIMLAGKLVNDAIAAFELPELTVPQFRVYAPRRLAQGVVAAAFAALAVFTLRTGVLAGWGHGDVPQLANALAPRDHGDTPIELLTADQNAPDVREVSRAVAQAAQQSPQGDKIAIVLDSSHEFTAGWGWYLRDYANLTFADMRKPYDAPAGAIVLADSRNRGNVHADATALALTFTKKWSFPGNFGQLTKSDIESRLVSSSAWSEWYAYLRDRTEAGRPSYVEGVAYFPRELSASVQLPRQSDVLAASVGPAQLHRADASIALPASVANEILIARWMVGRLVP